MKRLLAFWDKEVFPIRRKGAGAHENVSDSDANDDGRQAEQEKANQVANILERMRLANSSDDDDSEESHLASSTAHRHFATGADSDLEGGESESDAPPAPHVDPNDSALDIYASDRDDSDAGIHYDPDLNVPPPRQPLSGQEPPKNTAPQPLERERRNQVSILTTI